MRPVLLALITLAAGCDIGPEDRPEAYSDALPPVYLTTANESGRVYHPEYLKGAQVWEALGFEINEGTGGLPECAYHWYEDFTVAARSCQISISIKYDPALIEKYGSDGVAFRSQRIAWLDDSVDSQPSWYLTHITAHEVGHILLNTDYHVTGILGAPVPGDMPVLTRADYSLACASIGVCL